MNNRIKFHKLRVLALALLAALVLCACGAEQPLPSESVSPQTQPLTEPVSADTQPLTEPTEPDTVADLAIETPYATLYYPGEWEQLLRTEISEEDGWRMDFSAALESGKRQALFSVTFGGRGTDPIGAVTTADGKVNVHLTVAEFAPDDTWTDSEINVVYAMQDAVNHVLNNLALEPADQTEEPEDMALDTPWGELHFPARWADHLATAVDESDGYTVKFLARIGDHEEQQLFAIHFGGGQGSLFGKTQNAAGEAVEIRVSVYELVLDESWTEEETSLIFAMQEDLNYLLEHLN